MYMYIYIRYIFIYKHDVYTCVYISIRSDTYICLKDQANN